MSQIGLSYTSSGGTPYNFVFDNFGENTLPRQYQESVGFDKSASGASILAGPAYRQKYMWAISTVVETSVANQFDVMFQAWDQDRSTGVAALCGCTDTTFGPSVSTNVLFSTPPSYTYMGPALTMISFGLMEA